MVKLPSPFVLRVIAIGALLHGYIGARLIPAAAVGLPLKGHGSPIKSLVFRADGKTLISVAGDGSLISWDVDPASWVARAQRVAGRENGNVLQDSGEEHYHKLFSDRP